MIKEQSIIPSIASIAYSTISASIYGGGTGALLGLSIGLIDEYLIRNDYCNKHYLGLTSYWHFITSKPLAAFFIGKAPYYSTIIKISSYIFTISSTYKVDDFLDFRYKFAAPLDSFMLINSIFDKNNTLSLNELNKIYTQLSNDPYEALQTVKTDAIEIFNNQFIYNFGCIYLTSVSSLSLTQFFNNKFAKYNGERLIPQLMLEYSGKQEMILRAAINILFYNTINQVTQKFLGLINDYIGESQYQILTTKFTNALLTNNNGRKILTTPKGKEIIDNLFDDLNKLNSDALTKLNAILLESTTALFAQRALSNNAPTIVAFFTATIAPINYIQDLISELVDNTVKKANELIQKIYQTRISIRENIEAINLRDGEDFITDKYQQLTSQMQPINTEIKFYHIMFDTISNCVNQFMNFISIFSIIKNVDEITLEKFAPSAQHLSNFYNFYSTNINYKMNSKQLFIAMDRIKTFFDIIGEDKSHQAEKQKNHENKITFTNYTLVVDGNNIVTINELSLELGKNYAITGMSGCGKSTTLIDLKSGVYGTISSSGNISLPKIGDRDAKIMFFNQKFYLPTDSTLMETIYFPNILRLITPEKLNQIKSQIIKLMQELQIDQFANDSKSDKGLISKLDSEEFKLSGGQEKKIAIIQAIINKADFYIFDETFSGLDQLSIILVQKALEDYLPNSTFLVVDHHALDNNYNRFYFKEIRFENNQVTISEILTKYSAQTNYEINNNLDTNDNYEINVNGEILDI
jgi:ABC-type uncharacterized transport system fused permease/ATPase subunit